MKTRTRYLTRSLWTALLVAAPGFAQGQSVAPLSPGDVLRVSWRARSATMLRDTRQITTLEFVRMDPSQLVGRRRGRLVVLDARAIRTVRRRIGTKPASAPAMVIGSGAGFAVGFLVGALSATTDDRPGGRSAADAGLSTGVLLGAPLGAFVAWIASRSHGIYEDVPIPRVRPVASLSRSGRVGLSFILGTR